MKKTKKVQANEILIDDAQRKRANKGIDALLKEHLGKRIIDLLPLIKLRYPNILAVALERVERRRDFLSEDDLVFLEKFKASLVKD